MDFRMFLGETAFEVDASQITACDRLEARYPNAQI